MNRAYRLKEEDMPPGDFANRILCYLGGFDVVTIDQKLRGVIRRTRVFHVNGVTVKYTLDESSEDPPHESLMRNPLEIALFGSDDEKIKEIERSLGLRNGKKV